MKVRKAVTSGASMPWPGGDKRSNLVLRQRYVPGKGFNSTIDTGGTGVDSAAHTTRPINTFSNDDRDRAGRSNHCVCTSNFRENYTGNGPKQYGSQSLLLANSNRKSRGSWGHWRTISIQASWRCCRMWASNRQRAPLKATVPEKELWHILLRSKAQGLE